MDRDNVLSLLGRLSIPTKNTSVSGSGGVTWLNVPCPFAPWTHAKGRDEHPSFGVTVNDNDFSYYKCLACGSKGPLTKLPLMLGQYRKQSYSKITRWVHQLEADVAASKPSVDWEDYDPPNVVKQEQISRRTPSLDALYDYPRAIGIPYLRNRGLTYPTVMKLGLRYDEMQQRVLFPVYYDDGVFAGITGRSIVEGNDSTKGRNPKVRDYLGLKKREVFLGLPRIPAKGKRIIVEGLFDYARLVQAGFSATRAMLGTSYTYEKASMLIDRGEPVVFFVDNDLAGWSSLFGVSDGLGGYDTSNAWAYQLFNDIPVWVVPYPKHFDGSDPGSLSTQQLSKYISKAWLFSGSRPTTIDGNATLTVR